MGAGPLTIPLWAKVAAMVGFNLLMSYQQRKRLKSDFDQEADQGWDLRDNTTRSDAPRVTIYGRATVGGAIVFERVREVVEDGVEYEDLWQVLNFANDPIDGVEQYFLDDQPVTLDEDGWVADGPYKSAVQIRTYLGHQTTADAELMALFPDEWTDQHVGIGQAYHIIRQRNGEAFEGNAGNPANVTVRARGKALYDPRDDSVAFSDNAVLVWLDNRLNHWGLSWSDFDQEDLKYKADVADEVYTLPDGAESKRFTINGAITHDQGYEHIEELMLSSMAAETDEMKGRIRLHLGVFRAPLLTLDTNDILTIEKSDGDFRDRFTAVRGRFRDPDRFSDMVPYFSAENPELDEKLGRRIWRDISYPLVSDHAQCQRLSRLALNQTLNDKTVTMTCNFRQAAALQIGDVIDIDYPLLNLRKGDGVTGWKVVNVAQSLTEGVKLVCQYDTLAAYAWNGDQYITEENVATLSFKSTPPPAPTNLTAEKAPGGYVLRYTLPRPPSSYDRIEVYCADSADALPEDRQYVGGTRADHYTVQASRNEPPKYYWVRSKNRQNYPSRWEPDGPGVSAEAGAIEPGTVTRSPTPHWRLGVNNLTDNPAFQLDENDVLYDWEILNYEGSPVAPATDELRTDGKWMLAGGSVIFGARQVVDVTRMSTNKLSFSCSVVENGGRVVISLNDAQKTVIADEALTVGVKRIENLTIPTEVTEVIVDFVGLVRVDKVQINQGPTVRPYAGPFTFDALSEAMTVIGDIFAFLGGESGAALEVQNEGIRAAAARFFEATGLSGAMTTILDILPGIGRLIQRGVYVNGENADIDWSTMTIAPGEQTLVEVVSTNLQGQISQKAATVDVNARFQAVESTANGNSTEIQNLAGLQIYVDRMGSKLMLFTDANGNLATIDLASGEVSTIKLSAGNVEINGVSFDGSQIDTNAQPIVVGPWTIGGPSSLIEGPGGFIFDPDATSKTGPIIRTNRMELRENRISFGQGGAILTAGPGELSSLGLNGSGAHVSINGLTLMESGTALRVPRLDGSNLADYDTAGAGEICVKSDGSIWRKP